MIALDRFQRLLLRGRIAFFVVLLQLSPPSVVAQRDSFEGPPINYSNAEVHDPVSELARAVESGETTLKYDDDHGYLRSVLKALDVPVSSQTLVFSKTSMQQAFITPRKPRAVYFNDDVYVGWCQHGKVLEFAATDPKQGATFLTLEQSKDHPPKFARDKGQCLTCHSSHRTQNVPGYLIRSVFANKSGHPEFGSGTFTTDHTSPLKERWGGWYVTGTHGDMRHMGNAIFDKYEGHLDREKGANAKSLDDFLSTEAYLSGHSDIVALMVMEHQTQMHNAIASANYETRRALHQSLSMNKLLDREPDFVSETSKRRINSSVDRVLKHLLFCDEFALESPVAGTSGFSKEFESCGITDSRGRSLRQLDMKTRLFQFPCSYMIYSAAFDALPDEVRNPLLVRLRSILESNGDSEQFSHLSATDRKNILDILTETKPEFRRSGA